MQKELFSLFKGIMGHVQNVRFGHTRTAVVVHSVISLFDVSIIVQPTSTSTVQVMT